MKKHFEIVPRGFGKVLFQICQYLINRIDSFIKWKCSPQRRNTWSIQEFLSIYFQFINLICRSEFPNIFLPRSKMVNISLQRRRILHLTVIIFLQALPRRRSLHIFIFHCSVCSWQVYMWLLHRFIFHCIRSGLLYLKTNWYISVLNLPQTRNSENRVIL